MSRSVFLHVCCAPCATAVLEKLREDDMDVHGLFYNPSIHPWKEFRRRMNALEEWAPTCGLPVEYIREYPLEENIGMLLSAESRCYSCFSDRLCKTASEASRLGFDCFTTTLTVSPYQNQDFIRKAALEAALINGVEYLHYDFRDRYRRSVELSRGFGMYRQAYCGCVFSERDRYLKRADAEKRHPQNGY